VSTGTAGALLTDGPPDAARTVVLAHGAGAAMDSPFLARFARGLAAGGLRVVRFEFPYMERRRAGRRSGAPDPAPVLCERWRSVIEALGGGPALVIGGKSLGGRIASMVADETRAAGLVCLGYPFHPPGRPERLRTAHLRDLATRALFVQGERDPFGGRDEVAAYDLSPSIRVHFLADGDHSFEPRARSGRTLEDNMEEAIAAALDFVRSG
jgi:predicted alpha/beta-hydrolase family hydrolase